MSSQDHDVYSLAMTAWEILTGRHPWAAILRAESGWDATASAADTDADIVRLATAGRRPDLRALPSSTHPTLVAVIGRAWAHVRWRRGRVGLRVWVIKRPVAYRVPREVAAIFVLQSPAATRVTAREFAAACHAVPPPPPSLPPSLLPPGWGRAQTRDDHHDYYFHPSSGAVQWTHPAAATAEVR